MKGKIITVLISIFCVHLIYAQKYIPSPGGHKAAPFQSAVLLEAHLNQNQKVSGTGFVLQDSLPNDGLIYLVTARHVISEKKGKNKLELKSPIWKVTFSEKLSDRGYSSFLLNLRKLRDKGAIIWSNTYDVVLIGFGVMIEGEFYSFEDSEQMDLMASFKRKQTSMLIEVLKPLADINIAEEIFISGYPTSLGFKKSEQYDYYKPLVSKGIVSSIYPEKETFITDCAVYPGNSGAPVIGFSNERQLSVLGIVIEYVPLINKKNNVDIDNSGYSVCLSSDVILKFAKQLSRSIKERGIIKDE